MLIIYLWCALARKSVRRPYMESFSKTFLFPKFYRQLVIYYAAAFSALFSTKHYYGLRWKYFLLQPFRRFSELNCISSPADNATSKNVSSYHLFSFKLAITNLFHFLCLDLLSARACPSKWVQNTLETCHAITDCFYVCKSSLQSFETYPRVCLQWLLTSVWSSVRFIFQNEQKLKPLRGLETYVRLRECA